ncbi:MAG: C39 family peptidase [Lachnospiraceae bacterium]|nr:C39 family peptidase [Lachnospiraceae bacterium]
MGKTRKKISKRARRRRRRKYIRNGILILGLFFVGIHLFGNKDKSEEKKVPKQKEQEVVEANAKAADVEEDAKEVDKEEEELNWGSYHTKEEMKEEEWNELPEKLKELYDKNEEAREFIVNYWENYEKEFDINLDEYENCKEVPLLIQWDKRWGYEEYSGAVFGLTGCGPTCLSMAAIYLKQDVSLTPKWMMEFSVRNGYSVTGHGSAWALMGEGAEKLGLESEELPLLESKLKERLENGCVIIAVLGPGDFTDKGHFIVITDYEEVGFIIRDPNSYKNTNKKWSYEELEGQIKNLWALSGR